MPDMRQMLQKACADCGAAYESRAAVRRYCDACQVTRRRASANRYAHAHPPVRSPGPHDIPPHVAQQRARGAQISTDAARGITWWDTPDQEWLWKLTIAMPFSYRMSKNSRFWISDGRKHVRADARVLQDEMIFRIKNAIQQGGMKIVQARLWLDILVQKPNHLGDAVNVLDGICDALVLATGLDDRWYSVRRLDWEIVKSEPRIYLSISQDTDVDHQVCSTCGQVLPTTDFYPKRGTKLGVDRLCRGCKRSESRLSQLSAATPEKAESC